MARSFRDLEVWKTGLEIAEVTYRVSAKFPDSERFGMISQMRRAAVSIPSNIAEGWGRGTRANLANFISIARGSACELESLSDLALRLKLLGSEDYDVLVELLRNFGRSSYSFMDSVKTNMVRDGLADYD